MQAESAATAALGCEDGAQGCGGECQGLVEELSDALYELALTGNRRVAAMCASPAGLACWALELLEEQACQVSSPFQRQTNLHTLHQRGLH